jgi:hypothetical protein
MHKKKGNKKKKRVDLGFSHLKTGDPVKTNVVRSGPAALKEGMVSQRQPLRHL